MLSFYHRKRGFAKFNEIDSSRKEKVHKTTLHPQRPHDDHNKNKSQTTQWATKCKVMIRGGKMEKKTTTQKSKGKLQRKQRHPRRLRRCWPSLRSHQTTQPTSSHKNFPERVGRERYHPATRRRGDLTHKRPVTGKYRQISKDKALEVHRLDPTHNIKKSKMKQCSH